MFYIGPLDLLVFNTVSTMLLVPLGPLDVPWLPPAPYNWISHFGWRWHAQAEACMRAVADGKAPPSVGEPSEQDLRWRAEDEWLDRQWHWLSRG